ncbi:Rha family transcriptional regulator [Clostridium estertheticum]|uniref:Rha family transcriptional regulator n=1 Tax=Clostridium estertheticum TaxID=238834 RepID=UPI001C0B8A5A|nr:Rha family transcriptional regulator [Clostridium estertheticum]MBU3216676.1 Rha family transcriptional regulator [Clostridium estertheticum]WAG54368.1 Rha family transcriptional regulator [Clostridium estertheticum]
MAKYLDEQGKERPMYIMDRQGFAMLVNKFTGDEATIFTYKYTKAFEESGKNSISQIGHEGVNMIPYKKGQKITDLMDITQEDLDKIIKDMAIGEHKFLYNSKDMRISLLKESNKKTRKIVVRYGDRPFIELYKEILKIE